MSALATEWEEIPKNAMEQAENVKPAQEKKLKEEADRNCRDNGETPARWFKKKFPALARDYDEAVLEHEDQETRICFGSRP